MSQTPSNDTAKTQTINILPVQALFEPEPTHALITFIGPAGTPFSAPIDPNPSGLNITNSTINSTTIGAITPSTGVFTNVSTTTGTVTTTPANGTDMANKAYVDAVAQGLSFKPPALVGTTVNITLSGLQTIDGVTVAAGDRVLVKNQTTQANNGIYVAASGTWARAEDANTYAELVSAYLFITSGSTQAGQSYVCTSQPGGTLGTTAITWTTFTNNATYNAGTGLTLAGTTFSITPVGTANTYGSASQVPVITTNASGQVSAVTNTAIAIANTAVSGLGTMSTQAASAVAITGGTITGTSIDSSAIGATTASTVRGTTITATSQFTGAGTGLTGTASGLSIGGSAASATTATTATNVTGGAAGSLVYQTAASTTSTLGLGTSGYVLSAGASAPQYVAQSTLAAGTATTATNLASGAAGSVPYQTGSGVTSMLGLGTSGYVLTAGASAPTYVAQSTIAAGSATTATTATNVAGGAAGSLVYQTGSGATSTLGLGTTNYVLTAGASAPQYAAQSTLSVGSATTATNLAGGAASQVPYQTGSGATTFLANGTAGQFLKSNGASAPSWGASTMAITDDTTTNATRYLLLTDSTTGAISTQYTSSTKFSFNPSTGYLTVTGLSSPTIVTPVLSGSITGTYTLAGTPTITSPTITNPTVTSYIETSPAQVTVGTGTTALDTTLSTGTVLRYILTASQTTTFTMPTATAGKSFVMLLKQAATTGNGIAAFTGVKWGTSGAPTITATAGKMDILSFISDGTNWYGNIAQGYTP